jgi:hypothetical protein
MADKELVIEVTVRDDSLVSGRVNGKEYTRPRNSLIFSKIKFTNGEKPALAKRLATEYATNRWGGTSVSAKVVTGNRAHGAPRYENL